MDTTIPTNKPVLAIDCDDVLMDFTDTLRQYHNEIYGTDRAFEHLVDWKLENVFGCTYEQMVERVHEFVFSPRHAQIKPVAGAVEATRRLSEYYTLMMVTARGDNMREETSLLLEQHFAQVFKKLHFANQHVMGGSPLARTKADICKEIGAVALIDDAVHNAIEVSNAGIPVCLLDKPWNRNFSHPNVTRVINWEELVENLIPRV